jgi:hypothetical protein
MGVGIPDISVDLFLRFSSVGSSYAGSDLHITSLGPLNERCYMSRGFMLIMFYCTSIQSIFTDNGEV